MALNDINLAIYFRFGLIFGHNLHRVLCNDPQCSNNFIQRSPYQQRNSADTASQLDVLGHDCDTLGVDGTQVGVFEETNQVSLRCLLETRLMERSQIAQKTVSAPEKFNCFSEYI